MLCQRFQKPRRNREMKHKSYSSGVLFCLVWLVGSAVSGFGQVSAAGVNYEKVALLKWYAANQTGTTFSVGSGPQGVAFDGANIWVANSGSDNVTKLRAADGANLGTFSVGIRPQGVAFDGANIWVANNGSADVTKLRAADGANLGTFSVGSRTQGVVFDGANIWVANG